jgi:hypothetical protein
MKPNLVSADENPGTLSWCTHEANGNVRVTLSLYHDPPKLSQDLGTVLSLIRVGLLLRVGLRLRYKGSDPRTGKGGAKKTFSGRSDRRQTYRGLSSDTGFRALIGTRTRAVRNKTYQLGRYLLKGTFLF